MNAHDKPSPADRPSATPTEPPADGPSAAPGHLNAMHAWSSLGAELASLGLHRLAIAARAAAAAAGGGSGVSSEEEDAIVAWFVTACVDVAIASGGVRAASAIWRVLISDWYRDPFETWPARCPVVSACPWPPLGYEKRLGDVKRAERAEFLAGIRVAAAGYVRTTIAGASAAEIDELRDLVRADDPAELETYRPWGQILDEDRPASEMLDRARHTLTQRHLSNDHACRGVEDWAHGFAKTVVEHTIPPVARIGAIAWFARVALRDEERAA